MGIAQINPNHRLGIFSSLVVSINVNPILVSVKVFNLHFRAADRGFTVCSLCATRVVTSHNAEASSSIKSVPWNTLEVLPGKY